MTTVRKEAQDPDTAPERLHKLIHLPGDRGAHDADAGWCRECVAANPSAAPDTLRKLATDADDTVARFNAARNPSLDDDTLQQLADDRPDFIANAARERLGMPLRPGFDDLPRRRRRKHARTPLRRLHHRRPERPPRNRSARSPPGPALGPVTGDRARKAFGPLRGVSADRSRRPRWESAAFSVDVWAPPTTCNTRSRQRVRRIEISMNTTALIESAPLTEGPQPTLLSSVISVEAWVISSRRNQGLDAKVIDPATCLRIQRQARQTIEIVR